MESVIPSVVYHLPENISRGGMNMIGAIRAKGMCRCGGKWTEERFRGRVVAIVCTVCGTQPRSVYIDGRGFLDRRSKVGRIYTDDDGRPLTYPVAERLLESIRRDKDSLKKSFDPSKWSKESRQGFRLSDAGSRWVEYLRETRSKTYADHQEIFLRHIGKRLGNLDVREIRAGAVEDLYRDLLGSFKPKTVQSILFAIRTLMNWMRRREELDRVPSFPEVKVPTRIIRWITREEQNRVVEAAKERYRIIFRVLIETGIRPGEAVALSVGDVQENGIVVCKALDERGKVKETKAGKIQFKRVSDDLFSDLISAGKGKLPGAPLFLQVNGRPFLVGQVSMYWRKAAKIAKVDAPLYEGTRHSFATRIRQEKEAAMGRELAREMGHGRVATTMKHYAPCPRLVPEGVKPE
jgi:integrase